VCVFLQKAGSACQERRVAQVLQPKEEGCNAQFRAEAFNNFNHTNFGYSNASLGSRNFGVITSSGDPRIFRLGLKFEF
jgi:hypothetical protein